MNNENITIGSTINELTIVEFIKKPDECDKYKSYPGAWVKCKCSCGKEVVAPLYGIKRGMIKSCGHYKGMSGAKVLERFHKTHPEQPNAIYYEYDGETKNISEWSRITGIPRTTLMYRINNNFKPKDIFKKEGNND